jgi:hypothetical protein
MTDSIVENFRINLEPEDSDTEADTEEEVLTARKTRTRRK